MRKMDEIVSLSPTTCSAILVGDHNQQLDDIPHLLSHVDNLVKDMLKSPTAIILFLQNPMDLSNIQYQSTLPIVRHRTIKRVQLIFVTFFWQFYQNPSSIESRKNKDNKLGHR